MDQVKAFISHSSDDALYVDALISLIGKNSLAVDKFLFVLLHHRPIRLLHIEHLYKVGDGNLLG